MSSKMFASLLKENKIEESKSNEEEEKKSKSPNCIFENPNSQNAVIPSESFLNNFDFYNCELVKAFADQSECEILLKGNFYPAKIILSEYRLMIVPQIPAELSNIFSKEYFTIHIFSIKNIDKKMSKDMKKYNIEILTYDIRAITLSLVSTSELYDKIISTNRPDDENAFSSFAYKYKTERKELLEKHQIKEKDLIDGWSIYTPISEFERQEVNRNPKIQSSFINVGFEACESYPEIIFLPSPECLSEFEIKNAMTFRSRNRLPILSYYDKLSGGSIWRCSQNKPGVKGNKNEFDEKLLNCIGKLSNIKDAKLIIYDARPYVAALGNMIKGGGFENEKNYDAKIVFCEIGNIHEVRNSFNKLVNLVTDKNFMTNKSFHSNFESTNWPNMLYQIIYSSIDIAQNTKAGYSTLLHCSDGWDRTSQLAALAQLLVDPYFRTIEGFSVLVEKDFVSFGHQFKLRNGFYTKGQSGENDISPVFFQFIDCVYQLSYQYPFLFEFNSDLLIFIADNLRTCKYGTFLYNHEKERKNKAAKNNTVSIWDDVLNFKNKFTNIFYKKELSEDFDLKSFPMYKIRLWEEYYLRYINLESKYFSAVKTLTDLVKGEKK